MVLPRSIKSKLRLWVVVIFVLTGTAGWMGIWGLLYIQSGAHYESIWALQAALFILVLLCQGFSAWAGWQLSRTLTTELNMLKEYAEKISRGDLKSEVKMAGSDSEIVAVGEALDRLRVSLGKAMDRLTKRSAATPRPPTADEG